MGKHKLRQDQTCLNCRHVVPLRFCPNCGQENTETRKTFHHLFIHFFEDLTHYENAFWKTLRNLVFRPASLSKEYLSGKRMSYLAPVRLYIFISFVTFFVISILPDDKPKSEAAEASIKKNIADQQKTNKEMLELGSFGYASVKELDSIQKFGKPEDRLSQWQYDIVKRNISLAHKYSFKEIKEKFLESFLHNFPKVLFIYMPLFALVLWIFQDKKKWYYFDHGIFTLHYFSFLLVVQLVGALITSFFDLFDGGMLLGMLSGFLNFALFLYMVYYFFPAHHRFYGESRATSFVKGSAMFFINMFFITVILLLYVFYTFLTIH